MPDFDLPSFSLGLDSDPDDGTGPSRLCRPGDAADHRFAEDSGLEEDGHGDEDAPRLVRRLRRGERGNSAGSKASVTISSYPDVGAGGGDADDDIEEFSSPEELCRDDKPSGHLRSVSGSEKVPLCRRYVGSVPSSGRSTVTKDEQPSTLSGRRSVVGKSSMSPLRRFDLVDLDSDSPTTSECADVNDVMFDVSTKVVKGANYEEASRSWQRRKAESSCTPGTYDLWKNFSPAKGFRILTPALDEVCEEYYQNKSQKFHAQASFCDDQWQNACSSTTRKIEGCSEGNCKHPPAHHYFFHDDPSIRNLVCRRLPHFSPIGSAYGQENMQPAGCLNDYMHQFANGESSGKASTVEQKTNLKKRSRAKSKAIASKAEKSLCPTGWVDPKNSGGIPMNAGKKRVQVTGKSAGHWYTAPGGKKVYVTGNGQELTGRSAYRYYRKENGKGSKKSKRKGNPNSKGKG